MSDVNAALRTARGFYPERATPDETGLDRFFVRALGQLRRLHRLRPRRFHDIVRHVDRHAAQFETMSQEELRWQVPGLRTALRSEGFSPDAVGRTFALIRQIATLELDERHYDEQLIGGWILLHGMVTEMATGEGKTLAATLPACTAALAGIPVHVITVNDYLTRRDAAWMEPVYEALGLRVGRITHDATPEQRRHAYRCEVTYCTNKEIAFDYLRDRLEIGRKPGPIRMRLERLYKRGARLDALRLRGLCFGIVDEADSVLIDEARTPLIISGPGDSSLELELYRQALGLSERMRSVTHYRVDFSKREVTLTERGRRHLEELGRESGGFWNARLRREDLVRKALTARYLYQRDHHYVIKDGKIQIVDEYTGRAMPGRSWEGGLHQLIETKEDCAVSTRTEVLARISYQRFFRRYLALAGMTGTARESRSELWSVYRLEVERVPTHRPLARRRLSTRLYRSLDEKWDGVVARIRELSQLGRPVLVGTKTIADSERLSRQLSAAGLAHRVLNALQDSEEAHTIRQGGQRGQITVATNMAGRGTDIRLGPGVAELGGLHVIATERHDARRIDRQLFGRCGRQGDPGSFEAIVSLEDDLIRMRLPAWIGAVAERVPSTRRGPGRWAALWLFRAAQHTAERDHFRVRRELMRHDEQLDDALAFSGTRE